jgi:hypothetical protein
MITHIKSEDRLVQKAFADHLLYAHNEETSGLARTLGRASKRAIVLVRGLLLPHLMCGETDL